jgi:hypothetical protein
MTTTTTTGVSEKAPNYGTLETDIERADNTGIESNQTTSKIKTIAKILAKIVLSLGITAAAVKGLYELAKYNPFYAGGLCLFVVAALTCCQESRRTNLENLELRPRQGSGA